MASSFPAAALSFLISLTLTLADNNPPPSPPAGKIGINYGRLGNNLPPPKEVATLLKSRGVTTAKIYDFDPTVLTAFSNTSISLIINLPNNLLPLAASSITYTDTFLKTNIIPFYPSTNITFIAVGNEVFSDPNPATANHLIPALTNLHSSLLKLNLSTIKLSSPLSLSVLKSSYPPSSGTFKPILIPSIIKPLLTFLRQTSSPLMINAYPFLAYTANSDQISLDYALFNPNSPTVTDPKTGLHYTNLLDAQIDAVYSAMSNLGYNDIPIIVSETGWPSSGDSTQPAATIPNAATYNNNLVKKILTGHAGTPLKPNQSLSVYLFALFNENQKPGPTSERNFGLFYPDKKKVYNLPLTLTELESSSSSSSNGSKAVVVPAPPAANASWCVANGGAGRDRLQKGLDYACGEGGADCGPIQPGEGCYDPNTVVAHASYAFNSYYQMNGRAPWTCDFGGLAHVVTQPPSYGNCQFPTGY